MECLAAGGAPRAALGAREPVQPLRTGALGPDEREPRAKKAAVKDDECGEDN